MIITRSAGGLVAFSIVKMSSAEFFFLFDFFFVPFRLLWFFVVVGRSTNFFPASFLTDFVAEGLWVFRSVLSVWRKKRVKTEIHLMIGWVRNEARKQSWTVAVEKRHFGHDDSVEYSHRMSMTGLAIISSSALDPPTDIHINLSESITSKGIRLSPKIIS